jgi:hypothetical protein
VGCSVEPIREVDSVQIEAVLREYYEAFNCYDLDRIETVFAREAWKEERGEVRALVLWAKDNNFKSEFVSILSIGIDGDSVWTTVEVESDRGLEKDYHRLVREHSSWKIAKLLTKKVNQSPPVETPPTSPCCPSTSPCPP